MGHLPPVEVIQEEPIIDGVKTSTAAVATRQEPGGLIVRLSAGLVAVRENLNFMLDAVHNFIYYVIEH